jgi:hypothetical protein
LSLFSNRLEALGSPRLWLNLFDHRYSVPPASPVRGAA